MMTLNDGLFCLALVILAIQAGMLMCRWRRALAARREQVLRREWLRGFNQAWALWGYDIRQRGQPLMHGFARRCEKCGAICGRIISERDEYFFCSNCKHQNPAPLFDPEIAKHWKCKSH